MENLSSDILEDDFVKIFEPIHGVQYLAGFHRVKIEHKYVTAPSPYYQIYSSVVWALNIIAAIYFVLNCEIKLEGISNVSTLQICEFLIVIINAVIAFRNNFCYGSLNSQIYVKLQKIDRVVKMHGAVNYNRKMYLLSALLSIVVPFCWCIVIYTFNSTCTLSICPALFFVQFCTVASYMENLLAASILLFLAKRLNYVNVTLEKEANRLREANISLTASQHYREKEQDQDKLVVAIHYILDSWADCIRLFQFQILLFTCQILVCDFVMMLSFVTGIRDKNADRNYLFMTSIIFLLAMTSIFTLSFLATIITTRMRLTRSICFNVLSTPTPGTRRDKLQKNVQHILMLLETTSTFTIYHIYTVDNRLPLHIFAITATYTIVLLQFATL